MNNGNAVHENRIQEVNLDAIWQREDSIFNLLNLGSLSNI